MEKVRSSFHLGPLEAVRIKITRLCSFVHQMILLSLCCLFSELVDFLPAHLKYYDEHGYLCYQYQTKILPEILTQGSLGLNLGLSFPPKFAGLWTIIADAKRNDGNENKWLRC